MTPPRSKAQIIKRLTQQRTRLEQYLATLSRDDMLQPCVVGAWSVKDILGHLADWEAHMSIWLEAARHGNPVENPDPGLTWQQLDLFNQRVYAAHRDQSLEEASSYFHAAHTQFMEMVAAMPEEELLAHGCYAFLGNDAIYDWLVAYANHDQWAKTEILKWMKAKAGKVVTA